MANASTSETSPPANAERIESTSKSVVQERLSRRGRRLIAHVGPLGWFVFDVAVALFSVMLAFVLTPRDVQVDQHVSALPFSFGFALIVGVIAHITGLHDSRTHDESNRVYLRVLSVVSMSMALVLVELSVIHYLKVGRFIVLITGFVTAWLMILARVMSAHFTANLLQTIGFVGDTDFCNRSARFVDSGSRLFSVKSRSFENEEDVVADWAVRNGIDEVVFESTAVNDGRDGQLLECLDQGVKVSSYSDFVEDHYLLVPVDSINANWVFSARLDLVHPYYHGVKRIIDIISSLLGLLLTGPLMLLAIVLIKLESSGPAIYSQIRTGQFDRAFRIYKLRTMVQDAEAAGAQWASASDSRITRLGKFLRKTRIDELPQFWNVLRGDMSLVGPRPERPQFVVMLKDEIPFYLQRHLVKPGLTGWAQINYPYGASVQDSQNKLTYDLYYVKRASLGLDLQILLRTVGTMMKGSR